MKQKPAHMIERKETHQSSPSFKKSNSLKDDQTPSISND